MSGVFISYRRNDNSAAAKRLYEILESSLHERFVFRDVDSIPPGASFPNVINEKLRDCEIMVAVIGRQWLTDRHGKCYFNDPDDWVRYEIDAALKRYHLHEIELIPLLVNGASMPGEEDLPKELSAFSRLQARSISDLAFDDNVKQLGHRLQNSLWGIRRKKKQTTRQDHVLGATTKVRESRLAKRKETFTVPPQAIPQDEDLLNKDSSVPNSSSRGYLCPKCGGPVSEAFVGADHEGYTIGEGYYTYAWLCYGCGREFGRWGSWYHDWDVGKSEPDWNAPSNIE